ncbi:MAG: HD domain-containing phosphohydrolase [Oceanospirillaceae bacterium]
MNKFDIHILLAGFSTPERKQLGDILSTQMVNLHYCDLDVAIESLPKAHVLLIGMQGIENEIDLESELLNTTSTESLSETDLQIADFNLAEVPAPEEELENPSTRLEKFVKQLKIACPYGLAYLLAPADKILSLTDAQQNQYRDFIIFPVNQVFLRKRLLRIIIDLQEKFVQLIKKRRLKASLQNSITESARYKASFQQLQLQTKDSNKHLIRMLSNQVFARMGQRASGRNQQLNLLLLEIANACGFQEEEINDLTNAWHLRNIGKMGFSDKILHTPYIQLSIEEQRIFNCHPSLSHAAMMIVRPLDKAAKIVLQHKEYLDGSGYPLGLTGDSISKQAQVLTVVNDYTELVAGRYIDRPFSTVEALSFLDNYATEKYDDYIVSLLVKILPQLSKAGKGKYDLLVKSHDLKIGMCLSRDLISEEGILLLSEGFRVDRNTLSRLQELEINLHESFNIFITQK